MRHYVIESKLSTSKQQKWVAAGISSVVAALVVLLMYWLHIRVPNPPFAKKDGELLLDFGLEEVSYGRPTDGGPSAFPPAKKEAIMHQTLQQAKHLQLLLPVDLEIL